MSSEIPPTDYFTGISFNPDFYQSSSEEYLTASTAKSYFLSYPTAQGIETISTLKTSSIESSAPTTAFSLLSTQTANLNIGNTTTGTSGQTIKIGASTLTSIHCGNIDHKGTTINNASAPALGDISICDTQTSGILNIGTGARLTTGNGGGINIGTGSNTATANPINIGSNSSAVKVNGTLTIGTNTPTAAASISSTGAISGTTITGSGLIKGSSFQNTDGSSTISSTGLIGGSAIQIALNGSISVGGLAAITNGIHVVGEIRSTTGNFLATAGTITAGNGLIGAYQNKSTSATASISTAGDILGISLSSGTGAITGGAITASGLILANGGLTVPSGQTFTNNGSFINTGAVTGAGLIVSGANNITLGTGTTAPIIGQLGYIQSVAYPTPTISTTNLVKTISSITLATGTWIITAGVSFGSTQGLTKGYLMIGNASKTNIAEVSNDSLYGCTTFMGITTNGIVTPNLTSYVSHTTSTIYYLNILATHSGSTLQPDYWKFYAIRIA